MRVLTPADRVFFDDMGYVIVREAAPPDRVQAVVDAIWAFQKMDPADPDTWYRKPERENGMAELNGAGMIEMYHHPALWAIRQLPKIYGAFVDIWNSEKLWTSIDRCNRLIAKDAELQSEVAQDASTLVATPHHN